MGGERATTTADSGISRLRIAVRLRCSARDDGFGRAVSTSGWSLPTSGMIAIDGRADCYRRVGWSLSVSGMIAPDEWDDCSE